MKKKIKGPAEKKVVKESILVTLLTNNIIWGWLKAKNNSEYDMKNRRLK